MEIKPQKEEEKKGDGKKLSLKEVMDEMNIEDEPVGFPEITYSGEVTHKIFRINLLSSSNATN